MAETPNEGNIAEIIRALYGSAGADIGRYGDALLRYLEGLGAEFEGQHQREGAARGASSDALRQVWAIPRASLAAQRALGATRTANMRQSLAAAGAGAATSAAQNARSAGQRTRERLGHERAMVNTREASRRADIDFTNRMREGQIARTGAEYEGRRRLAETEFQGRERLARTEFDADRQLKELTYRMEREEREARKREEEEARRRAEEEARRLEAEFESFAGGGGGGGRGGGRGRGRGRGGGGGGGRGREMTPNQILQAERQQAKILEELRKQYFASRTFEGGFRYGKDGARITGPKLVEALLARYMEKLGPYGWSRDEVLQTIREIGALWQQENQALRQGVRKAPNQPGGRGWSRNTKRRYGVKGY